MAGELTKYRNSTVGSEETLYFLEVPTKLDAPETKAFHMMHLRGENANVETGVETEVIPDVTQKVQPTDVKSYAFKKPVSGLLLIEDPVCRYLYDLYERRATGSEAHCNMIRLDKWNNNKAEKVDVTIAIQNITAEAGGQIKLEAELGYASDSVFGTATYDADTGIATFSPSVAGV